MKSLTLMFLALPLACASAFAQDTRYDDAPNANVRYAWADVLRVDPVYATVQRQDSHEECEDVPVAQPYDNGNKAAGTVIGAIVGGVLGSTVGKGDGRKAATVAGAVAGGAIGNSVASRDSGGYYDGSQRQCRTVYEPVQERRIDGYDVQYRYRGDVYSSRLDYDPGDRIRVKVSIIPAE